MLPVDETDEMLVRLNPVRSRRAFVAIVPANTAHIAARTPAKRLTTTQSSLTASPYFVHSGWITSAAIVGVTLGESRPTAVMLQPG
jgi:hypothetical protein